MRGERVSPYLFYIALGYLMGGMLFADWLPKWLHGADVAANSDDGNPGTFNAFAQCGVPTGMLVLTCELGKAFLPVFAAGRRFGVEDRLFALVMLAPVLGHIFPIARRGHGGKGHRGVVRRAARPRAGHPPGGDAGDVLYPVFHGAQGGIPPVALCGDLCRLCRAGMAAV